MSEIGGPIQFVWRTVANERVLVPATPYQLKLAAARFEDGKRYVLIEHQDRSVNSHSHYFAALAEAWQQIPEGMADDFPTVEHLRKHALIKVGFYDQRSIVCADATEAKRFAAFMRPLDDFAIVSVCGPAVVVRTAKSQAYCAQNRKEFNEAKQKVLAWVCDLIGVDLDALEKNVGRAA